MVDPAGVQVVAVTMLEGPEGLVVQEGSLKGVTVVDPSLLQTKEAYPPYLNGKHPLRILPTRSISSSMLQLLSAYRLNNLVKNSKFFESNSSRYFALAISESRVRLHHLTDNAVWTSALSVEYLERW